MIPHGLGIKITDKHELNVLEKVFRNKKPFLSVFKPYVGHNLGGCCVLETALLLLCLKENSIIPFLYTNNLDPRIQQLVVNEVTTKKIDLAMKISCGFAGFNGAVIFKKIK